MIPAHTACCKNILNDNSSQATNTSPKSKGAKEQFSKCTKTYKKK